MQLAHVSHKDPVSSICEGKNEDDLEPNIESEYEFGLIFLDRHVKGAESLSDLLIRTVLLLIQKDTPDYSRHVKEYFQSINLYASFGVTEVILNFKFFLKI